MLKTLLDSVFSPEVLRSKTITIPVVAFLFALAIAAVAYFLFSGSQAVIQGKQIEIHFGAITTSFWQVVIFLLFIFAFVLIWFLLYSQFQSEVHDVYSGLRKKLVGAWTVQYEIEPGQRPAALPLPAVGCTIALNPVAKLEMRYAPQIGPLYDEDTGQVIQGIGLTHRYENRYSLSYYYRKSRKLSAQLSNLLMNEADTNPLQEIEVEIFVVLEFEDDRSAKRIDGLRGKWFDLNGNLIRLFALAHELDQHAQDPTQTRRRLSDAKVDRENFQALMGEIRFLRVLSPDP